MFGEVAIEAEDLKSWRITIVLQPEIELTSGASGLRPNTEPMGRAISSYMVYGQKHQRAFPATLAHGAVLRKRV